MQRGSKRANREESGEKIRGKLKCGTEKERYGAVKIEGELYAISHVGVTLQHSGVVKWRDNSHLKPYASTFTHKDSHPVRLMLLCQCYHMHVFV